jgi:dTDP-4-dehydrorhamnose 3,5-epimerase-like enzyme
MNFEIIKFHEMGDDRGMLISLESSKTVPFDIARVYYIYDTKAGVRRGFHSHKTLKQLCVAVRGHCKFLLDDGREKVTVDLNEPTKGLLIQGNLWREMFDFSHDCVLMVLADQHYDESDYIRDYQKFLEQSRENN